MLESMSLLTKCFKQFVDSRQAGPIISSLFVLNAEIGPS